MAPPNVPGTFSPQRIATLLASLLCSLSSGTNYAFSAYAPQLGSRLHLNHTFLNVVGLGGNVGVYLTGPLWGKIVDARGPRILLLAAFTLLLIGYSGIRTVYNSGLPEGATTLPHLTAAVLVLCSFMTGVGGNAGMASGINTTAKNFPDSVRGTTTGLVVSGFGLSAFLFSTLAHVLAPGDTSSFLLILSLGTSVPMLVGLLFMKQLPLPASDVFSTGHREDQIDYAEVDAASIAPSVLSRHHEDDSMTHLLGRNKDDDEETAVEEGRRSIELSPPSRDGSASPGRTNSSQRARRRSRSTIRPMVVESGPNVYGRKLFASSDFWLLFCILSLLSGTGLMYINNVGSMSQALYAHDSKNSKSPMDDVESSKWQATQVSTISFMSFAGRVSIGLLSDFVKARFGLPRSYLLLLVSSIALVSQLTAANVDKVTDLWKASALLGLGYGTVFSLFAAICVEWFGLAHYSENWGYLSLSPLIGGNIFSVAFGRNLDAHERAATSDPNVNPTRSSSPISIMEKEIQCLDGKACYVDSIKLTTVACLVAIGLSVWAAWRDKKRLEEEAQRLVARNRGGNVNVIWEEDEE